MRKKVIAVLCSDLHLSDNPPPMRVSEKVSWHEQMEFYLRQLRALSDKHGAVVLCAGDVFDYWKASPSLISFAIKNLPHLYAIPGQHDLPLHNYNDIKKSAYWTLVEAGKITNLTPNKTHTLRNGVALHVTPFPWGFDVKRKQERQEGINVAMVHAYCWKKGCEYTGAHKKQNQKTWLRRLRGYDVALFGDNHKGFLVKHPKITILNNGGFMRRKTDEIEYTPSVGLLYSDGSVVRHYLDTPPEIDSFTLDHKKEDKAQASVDVSGFIEELNILKGREFNFVEACELYAEKTKMNKRTKEILKHIMEGVAHGHS